MSNELESVLQSLFFLPDIDQMRGVNLDVIGKIVGANRIVGGVVTLTFFGFADTGSYATRFGEEGIQNLGSRFYEENENFISTSILNDVEYQFLLKAKIIKNSSSGTCEDIIAGLQVLFNTLDVKLTDNEDMTITIGIGRPLLSVEEAIVNVLDALPRPAGVRITDISSFVVPDSGYTGGTEGADF
jgi:hypothetical protein